MREAWKEYEGRVVNKEFRLEDYLGGSEHAGVFLTQYGPESRKAAVKLIPIGARDEAEAEISRLQSARELSHPHLLQILQAGRTNLDDRELLFVVMEYADEDLSQILPNRALTAAEVREMLKPILEALGYLHGRGLVHGHLNPSNVMAIGDQVKLSSEGISRSGERRAARGQSSDYDAPEVARGENFAASDVWSLGILLVAALTQSVPGLDASGAPILLETVPAPFDEIARRCLGRDAGARWSVADIAARLGFGSPAELAVAKPELQPSAGAARAAVAPRSVVPQQRITPPRDFPYRAYRGRWNTGAYVAAAVVLAIVGVFVGLRVFRGVPGTSAVEQIRPTQAPSEASSGIAQLRGEGGSGGASTATSRAKFQPGGEKADRSASREKPQRQRVTAGQVAEQVVPDVPQSARDTIHGTVRVGVRISVDSAGSVTEAELDSPGPSKYFAQLALEAAQQWKFEPPKVAGRNVLSDWLLHFQFTGTGTKVIPVQSEP
jgi:TonB family protein